MCSSDLDITIGTKLSDGNYVIFWKYETWNICTNKNCDIGNRSGYISTGVNNLDNEVNRRYIVGPSNLENVSARIIYTNRIISPSNINFIGIGNTRVDTIYSYKENYSNYKSTFTGVINNFQLFEGYNPGQDLSESAFTEGLSNLLNLPEIITKRSNNYQIKELNISVTKLPCVPPTETNVDLEFNNFQHKSRLITLYEEILILQDSRIIEGHIFQLVLLHQ